MTHPGWSQSQRQRGRGRGGESVFNGDRVSASLDERVLERAGVTAAPQPGSA
jgi:hypothetical protein